MLITIELCDDEITELRREAAELGPHVKVETLVGWYLRFGMRQWQAGRQEAEQLPGAGKGSEEE